jgi:uncharacterized protein YjbI with pentapeptide repeats
MKKRNPYDIIIAHELYQPDEKVFDEPKVMDTRFENRTIKLETQIEFNGCSFERVVFSGDFRKTQFIDCIMDRCDLSNTDFEASRFHRVKISGSKGIGIRFAKAKWQYVTIDDSVMTYGAFSDVDFQDVSLTKCDLSQSSFFTADLKRISLHQLNLSQTDFSDTPLSGLDFSTSEIDGIRVSTPCLKGLIVNASQAVALIRLFGVDVTQ